MQEERRICVLPVLILGKDGVYGTDQQQGSTFPLQADGGGI